MRGWGIGAASGLLAGALACTEPAVFTCGGNDDCVLGGVKGQCQDTGSCAYPDDDCTSGLSYPEGAPPDLAGRCVPGDGGTGGDTGPHTGSSGEADTSTDGSTAGATVAVDDGSTTGDATSDDGSSDGTTSSTDSSGGVQCDPDVVGDTQEEARFLGGCSIEYSGVLEDTADVDWYALGICSDGMAFVDVALDPEFSVVCLVALCEQGDSPMIACDDPSAELPGMDGLAIGCCGAEAFQVDYACPKQATALFVVAASAPEAPQCTAYTFSVIAEDG